MPDLKDMLDGLRVGDVSPTIDYVDGPPSSPFIRELDDALFYGAMNERAARCGPLVVGKSVSEPLSKHLQTAQSCFVTGLYEPTIVFCRGILEVAAFEFFKQRVPSGERISPIEERSDLRLLLERLTPHPAGATLKYAHDVRRDANDILHFKRHRPAAVSEDRAFAVLKNTFAFVEALFDLE